jgi:hypothetical protein
MLRISEKLTSENFIFYISTYNKLFEEWGLLLDKTRRYIGVSPIVKFLPDRKT